MSGESALLLGGPGFIGSAFAGRLKHEKIAVSWISPAFAGNCTGLPKVALYEGVRRAWESMRDGS